MQITSVDQLKIGMTVYYATCIGECNIKGYTLTSEPYIPESMRSYGGDCFFVDYETDSEIFTSFSLRDCNVIPNDRNKHRLYSTREEAEHYIAMMKETGQVPPYTTYTYLDCTW